jgi:hypothetical protein
MYEIRVEDEHGVVLMFKFGLTRREAVRLYWEAKAYLVQLLYKRHEVIAERRS